MTQADIFRVFQNYIWSNNATTQEYLHYENANTTAAIMGAHKGEAKYYNGGDDTLEHDIWYVWTFPDTSTVDILDAGSGISDE